MFYRCIACFCFYFLLENDRMIDKTEDNDKNLEIFDNKIKAKTDCYAQNNALHDIYNLTLDKLQSMKVRKTTKHSKNFEKTNNFINKNHITLGCRNKKLTNFLTNLYNKKIRIIKSKRKETYINHIFKFFVVKGGTNSNDIFYDCVSQHSNTIFEKEEPVKESFLWSILKFPLHLYDYFLGKQNNDGKKKILEQNESTKPKIKSPQHVQDRINAQNSNLKTVLDDICKQAKVEEKRLCFLNEMSSTTNKTEYSDNEYIMNSTDNKPILFGYIYFENNELVFKQNNDETKYPVQCNKKEFHISYKNNEEYFLDVKPDFVKMLFEKSFSEQEKKENNNIIFAVKVCGTSISQHVLADVIENKSKNQTNPTDLLNTTNPTNVSNTQNTTETQNKLNTEGDKKVQQPANEQDDKQTWYKKHSKKIWFSIFSTIIILGFCGGVYYYYNAKKDVRI